MKIRITEGELKAAIRESLKREMILNEQIRNGVNGFITEDYGINNDLDEKLSGAINVVTKQLKGSDFIKGDDGIRRKIVRGNLSISGKTVRYEIINYWFNNGEEFENFISRHITPQGYISMLNTIFIPLFSVGKGFSYEDFCDSFYHEVEHAFQDIMGNSITIPPKVYRIAISNLNSQDEVERAVADMFYIGDRKEQDAFVNGLWAYVSKSEDFVSMNEKIKETEAFTWLKRLYKDKELLEKCENLGGYLQKYGKKRENFLAFAGKVVKSFERKIARVVFRLKKNKMIAEGYRPHIKPNDNLRIGQIFWI